MYFSTLLCIHIAMIFLWLYLKYKYHWSVARANLDQFFAEQHERLNITKSFNHFMGRVDPYKDVKSAVDQLDRHFNDVYKDRYRSRQYPMRLPHESSPNITPQPNLEEVIINVALNPNTKQTTNGKS